jgi:hypothetical protein
MEFKDLNMPWKHAPVPKGPQWRVTFINSITRFEYSEHTVDDLSALPRKGDMIVAEVQHDTKPYIEYEVKRITLNYDLLEAVVHLEAFDHRSYMYTPEEK